MLALVRKLYTYVAVYSNYVKNEVLASELAKDELETVCKTQREEGWGAGLEVCMCRVSYSSYVYVFENHVP